jgi:soluble lytic murein transglycosylase-like protein
MALHASRALCWLALLIALDGPGESARADVYVYADKRGVVHFSDQPRHPGYRPYGMASYRRGLAAPRAWDGVIDWASRTHGVPPGLVKAVVHVESSFNPKAVSPRGAAGLMQLMPVTARTLGVDDPFNPWQNIDGGTRYLGKLVRRYAGNLELALAAYNAGEEVVARFGGVPPYRETRYYVQRVLALYERYGGDFR